MTSAQHPETIEYTDWAARPLADPRAATQLQFEDGLFEIAEAEGPVLAYRMYQIFARAGSLGKITASTKARMDLALTRMIEEGKLLAEAELDSEDVSRRIIRMPDQEAAVIRTLGSRSIDEVPPSELAEMILWVRSTDELLGREEIYRAVLAHYGLQKITALAKKTFEHVLNRYF